MKFIKLTNANPDNLGDPIYLNEVISLINEAE